MNGLTRLFLDTVPVLRSQTADLGIQMFKSSSVDPTTLIYFLVGIIVMVVSLVYGTYRYQQWRKFKLFAAELKALDLNPENEGTFSDMVKRYKFAEPVNVIFSKRLFDEMAEKEIRRILSSAGSFNVKQQYIDIIYAIRTQTYHSDWLVESDELEEEPTGADAPAAG